MAFGKFGKYYPGDVQYRLEPVDIVAALRADFERVRADEGVAHAMRFHSPLDAHVITTDRLHVHYIAMNLLLNAVKYSAAGSPVDLVIRIERPELSFSVSDHGIGIPRADVDAIFSPFFRASNVGALPGSGMGLAIVKKSAQLIGARLVVASTASGTSVTVLLSADSTQPARAHDS